MSRSALVLCLLVAVCGAAHPSTLRGLTPDDGDHIIGPWPVSITQFPWQVSLEYICSSSFTHFCSGSIISSTWVLTAAYCIHKRTAQDVYVRAGSSFREHDGTVYIVATMIAHEYYNRPIENDYDVGLLEIAERIDFGSRVQAVNLANSELDMLTRVNVTSWGYTSSEKLQLQAITALIIPRDACKRQHEPYGIVVTERMICASGRLRGKHARPVSTGGPLVVGNTQYGIVSQRMDARPDFSGIYSSVPALRGWITEKTGV